MYWQPGKKKHCLRLMTVTDRRILVTPTQRCEHVHTHTHTYTHTHTPTNTNTPPHQTHQHTHTHTLTHTHTHPQALAFSECVSPYILCISALSVAVLWKLELFSITHPSVTAHRQTTLHISHTLSHTTHIYIHPHTHTHTHTHTQHTKTHTQIH